MNGTWIDRILSRFGLRLCHRRWFPKGTDRKLYLAPLPGGGDAELEPGLIFDVGANVGQTTRAYRYSFPEAVIHAFEPVPKTFSSLLHNTKGLDRVNCHNIGFSDNARKASMLVGEDSQINRIARDSGSTGNSSVEATLTTLDAFVDQERITRIDILKSDTEGHELDVLEGARKALSHRLIRSILVESTLDADSTTHVPLSRLEDFLKQHGFELFGIYDFGFSPAGRLGFFNALFKLRQRKQPPTAE